MSDLLEIAQMVRDGGTVSDDLSILLRDLIHEVEHRDSRVEAAKAILLELEQEMGREVDIFAGSGGNMNALAAACARVVGARKVIEALGGME
jgi:hypothetical protein